MSQRPASNVRLGRRGRVCKESICAQLLQIQIDYIRLSQRNSSTKYISLNKKLSMNTFPMPKVSAKKAFPTSSKMLCQRFKDQNRHSWGQAEKNI